MDLPLIIASIFSGIIGAFGGSFSIVLFYRSMKRKNNAIAESHEITNDKEYLTIYKDLVKEYQQLICFKNNCNDRIP